MASQESSNYSHHFQQRQDDSHNPGLQHDLRSSLHHYHNSPRQEEQMNVDPHYHSDQPLDLRVQRNPFSVAMDDSGMSLEGQDKRLQLLEHIGSNSGGERKPAHPICLVKGCGCQNTDHSSVTRFSQRHSPYPTPHYPSSTSSGKSSPEPYYTPHYQQQVHPTMSILAGIVRRGLSPSFMEDVDNHPNSQFTGSSVLSAPYNSNKLTPRSNHISHSPYPPSASRSQNVSPRLNDQVPSPMHESSNGAMVSLFRPFEDVTNKVPSDTTSEVVSSSNRTGSIVLDRVSDADLTASSSLLLLSKSSAPSSSAMTAPSTSCVQDTACVPEAERQTKHILMENVVSGSGFDGQTSEGVPGLAHYSTKQAEGTEQSFRQSPHILSNSHGDAHTNRPGVQQPNADASLKPTVARKHTCSPCIISSSSPSYLHASSVHLKHADSDKGAKLKKPLKILGGAPTSISLEVMARSEANAKDVWAKIRAKCSDVTTDCAQSSLILKSENDCGIIPPDPNLKMSPLDYLISKVLVERIDIPIKPCNTEIKKIYSGEHKGKLRLVDLIELQVEESLKA